MKIKNYKRLYRFIFENMFLDPQYKRVFRGFKPKFRLDSVSSAKNVSTAA